MRTLFEPSIKSPRFLNVDLEIESKSPLQALARELGSRVSILHSSRWNGHHFVSLSIAGARGTQETILNAFCKLIEGLSPRCRALWNTAIRKEFDLGYEMRLSGQRSNRIKMRPKTLQRISKLGASVAVTLYREEDWD